jgi:hypothetical protein
VNGHYEIVAGERRWRAAKLAALAQVPVIVRELDDTKVLEIMVIENNQREDVNPLEEGEGFARLLKTGYDLEKLAERIGRSQKYIYDRMKLLDLIPDARQHLEHGRMTAGHAILIARLKPEDQKRVIATTSGSEYGGRRVGGLWEHHDGIEFETGDPKGKFAKLKAVSVRELEAWIADHVRFDVEHFGKAAPLDFGDTAANVQEALRQPGRGKKVIPITYDYHATSAAAASEDERTYGNTAWKRADGSHGSKTCEHSLLGTVVAGRHYGQAFDVCIARDKCQVHWKEEMAERERNRKRREKGQPAKAAKREETYFERQKREQEEAQRRERAWETVRERAVVRFAEALKKEGASRRVLEAVAKDYLNIWDKEGLALLHRVVGKITAANLAVALLVRGAIDDESRECREFVTLAKAYGIDLRDLELEYEKLLKPVQASAESKPAAAKKKAPAKKKSGKKR